MCNEAKKVATLFIQFQEQGLVEDRLLYDEHDLLVAYQLNNREAHALWSFLQEADSFDMYITEALHQDGDAYYEHFDNADEFLGDFELLCS